jgi:peptide/nickel transport system permease protein
LGYIVRRLIWGAFLLLLITFLCFFIFYILPSADPAKQRAGKQATPAQVERIRHQQGLDKPFYEQYGVFLRDIVLHFDFGDSIISRTPVKDRVLDRIPATLSLALGAVLVWMLAAFVVGIVSAAKQRSLLDRVLMTLALVAVSAPVYWLGLIMLYLFSKDLGQFPLLPGQDTYPEQGWRDFGAWFQSLIMPWCVLAASFAAIYARVLRSNLVEVLSEDYIRTARAKGLSERRVVLKHGLRAAITPIVTLVGIDLGVLLGGAILTETVFNIPGLGRESFSAIHAGDLPIVQGVVIFAAAAIIILNLVVDIAYAFLDPRVRY